MTYATEFPDFDAATLPAIPASWEDVSWHNDACPSFMTPDVSGARFLVYVDYLFPEDREFPFSQRFTIHKADSDGGTADDSVILTGDDWSAVLAMVDALAFLDTVAASNNSAPRPCPDLASNLEYQRQLITAATDPSQVAEPVADVALYACSDVDSARMAWTLGGRYEFAAGEEAACVYVGPDSLAILWDFGLGGYVVARGVDNGVWDWTEESARWPEFRDALMSLRLVSLAADFATWTAAQGLAEQGDALELLMGDLTHDQRQWLSDFVTRWEAAERA